MSRLHRDEGSALVEFTWLAVLLMVPLVYVLIGLFQVQSAAFGVTEAARQAGRALARAEDCGAGMVRARAAAGLALRDQGIARGWTMPPPTGCPLVAGEPVTVQVAYVVQLPLVGRLFPEGRGGIPVRATHSAVVDRFREAA